MPHDDAALVAEPLEDAASKTVLKSDFGSLRQADVGSDSISPQNQGRSSPPNTTICVLNNIEAH